MAGGIFNTQNKIRPGVYLKFQGVPSDTNLLGVRGIVTFAAPIGWGSETDLIEITVNDLFNSNLEKLIGCNIYDSKAKLIKSALENAHTLLLQRGDLGGVKATASIEVAEGVNLLATAKYSGIVGNNISILVKANTAGGYSVSTYLNSIQKDNQFVNNLNELVSNDFVDFNGEGVITKEAVNTLLTNGTNGTFQSSDYSSYLAKLRQKQFDTLAAYDFGTTSLFNPEDVKNFIQEMRDTKGIKCQAVINNYVAANYEGIISTYNQGVKFTDGSELDGKEFVIYIAGATAGADINESNTYKVINNAVEIISAVSDDNIESLLLQGYLIISNRRDGVIVIEKDINTLTILPDNITDAFKDNKVIRLLDAVANHIANDFEQNFIGKVVNDANGRALCKANINSYLTSLQNSGAITNFNSNTDVTVEEGENPDSYYAEVFIQPTYSVDKLYMIVNVK